MPEGASGQAEPVAARFALVGAAGELATEAQLTGWPVGESERAACVCFGAWLRARGGAGNGEAVSMLRAVRRFLESHGDGRFTWWHRAFDDHNAKTLQRAGFGTFENLHDLAGGAAFSSHLTREAQACHGASGPAFLEWACGNADGLAKRVRTRRQASARQWVPDGASGQVERVAARFALVGAAGELATEAQLTGWPVGGERAGSMSVF